MPIYEYRCDSCAHEMEAIQKMSDEPLTECPACGKATLKKLISAAGFRLKGGGWYETDFKNKGNKPQGGTNNESKGKEGAGQSSGSSAKTASGE